MPVYHIVLFKLKPGVEEAQIEKMKEKAQEMVGQIPGLSRIDLNTPLESTRNRGKGYDMGLVAVLDKPETVKIYADHPSHQVVNELRLAICDDTLAYDLVF